MDKKKPGSRNRRNGVISGSRNRRKGRQILYDYCLDFLWKQLRDYREKVNGRLRNFFSNTETGDEKFTDNFPMILWLEYENNWASMLPCWGRGAIFLGVSSPKKTRLGQIGS